MEQQPKTNSSLPENRHQNLKASVMALLNWDDLAYGRAQYEAGIAYLKLYLEGDEHAADQISRSRVYWAWWRNHWANRDEQFLAYCANTALDRVVMRELYADWHNPTDLARTIHPHGVVLNESYAQMMTALVATETQKV